MSNRRKPKNPPARPATFWNGVPALAIRGTAVVAVNDDFPKYWARDLIGYPIEVVGIQWAGKTFFISNRPEPDERGWWKVTEGKGSPRLPHKNLSIEPNSFRPASVQ